MLTASVNADKPPDNILNETVIHNNDFSTLSKEINNASQTKYIKLTKDYFESEK